MPTSTAAAMHYWDAYWDLRIAECPCDVHFMTWIDANAIVDKAIYHFGTGGHHHVGIECASPKRRNAVLGITAAPQEHETYLKLAIERPDVLRHYNCIFGDIYLINPKLLPDFDVVTLFHLCEFRSEKNDAYGALTDLEVAEILTDKTAVGGHILFYTGSFAFEPAKAVIAQWEKTRAVEKVGLFETLLVYRKVA
jgi:hypothetical protein